MCVYPFKGQILIVFFWRFRCLGRRFGSNLFRCRCFRCFCGLLISKAGYLKPSDHNDCFPIPTGSVEQDPHLVTRRNVGFGVGCFPDPSGVRIIGYDQFCDPLLHCTKCHVLHFLFGRLRPGGRKQGMHLLYLWE